RPFSFTWRFVRIGRSPDVWVFGHVGGNDDVDHLQEVLEGRHLAAVEPVMDGTDLHAEQLRESDDVSEFSNHEVEQAAPQVRGNLSLPRGRQGCICMRSALSAKSKSATRCANTSPK